MSGLIEVLFVLFLVLMLVLGVIVLGMLWQGRDTDRQRARRNARLADQRLTDIGAQTQAAIMEEALRRAHTRQAPYGDDVPPWQHRGNL